MHTQESRTKKCFNENHNTNKVCEIYGCPRITQIYEIHTSFKYLFLVFLSKAKFIHTCCVVA